MMCTTTRAKGIEGPVMFRLSIQAHTSPKTPSSHEKTQHRPAFRSLAVRDDTLTREDGVGELRGSLVEASSDTLVGPERD